MLALENAFIDFVLELLSVTFYQSFSLWNLFWRFMAKVNNVSDSQSIVFPFNHATRQIWALSVEEIEFQSQDSVM
jgi:hypothetical protein